MRGETGFITYCGLGRRSHPQRDAASSVSGWQSCGPELKELRTRQEPLWAMAVRKPHDVERRSLWHDGPACVRTAAGRARQLGLATNRGAPHEQEDPPCMARS